MSRSDDGLVDLVIAVSPSGATCSTSRAQRNDCARAVLQQYLAGRSEWPTLAEQPVAVVVVDRRRNEVHAAIDPAGVHQLYYLATDRAIVVASRLPALLERLDTSPSVRPQAIYDYVYFSAVPSPKTLYEGVLKLPAGYRLEWSPAGLRTDRYFDVAFQRTTEKTVDGLAAELRRCLSESVARAAGANGTTGAFLSGGLDSSTVAGYLADLRRPSPVSTFSIGFAADGYDEIEFARLAARRFGTHSVEHYVTPEDVLTCVREVAGAADEPFGNSSVVPAFYCARLARESGITRLLAGDGGDELFAGNSRYAKQLLFERYFAVPAAIRRSILESFLPRSPVARLPLLRKLNSYVQQARVPLPDRLQSYNYLHRHAPGAVFSRNLLDRIDPAEPLGQLRAEYDVHAEADRVDRMLFLDWKFTLHDNDLVKVNAACRLAGVDVSYPMLDPALIRFSCTVPGPLKLHRGQLRWFYKRAMQGFLPAKIIDKRKHGFGLPFGVWMRTHPGLRRLSEETLQSLSVRGIFNENFLPMLLRLHQEDAAAYYGELVWILTALELWLQAHAPSTRF